MADQDQLFSGLSDDQLSKVELMADAAKEIQRRFQAANRALRDSGQEASNVGQAFSKIAKGADLVREIQDNISNSAKNTEKALKAANDQRSVARKLQVKIDDLIARASKETGKTAENLRNQAYNLSEARDQATGMAEAFDQIADDSASLDKSAGFFNSIAKISESIPGLKNLSGPFKDAAKAAKETALSNARTGKSMSTLVAGSKAFAKSIGAAAKAFLPLLIVQTIAKVLKFIVSLFTSANAQTVAIAKNLGISKDQASVLRREIANTVEGTDRLYVTTDRLIEAQSQLVGLLERGGTFQQDNLIASTFLQHRLGLAADEASKLVGRAEAFGLNANEGVTSIIDLRNELTRSGDNTATIGQLLKGVSEASGQIAASFGFSNQAIAKGVIAVRKFGLNLTQARSISESLLDFETSIGNELEAELLTGRQFNFERARALAATGDIAGATQEVMKQMKGLTAEQRKSPIIMQSLASAVGLSVDQLQDAYMLETDRARQGQQRIENEAKYAQYVKQVNRELGLQGEEREELLKKRRLELGIDDAQREALEKNVTIQEAFNESLNRARDAFNRMVDSNALDKLTDLIIDFANRASQVGFGRALLGGGVSAKQQQEAVTSAVGTYDYYQDKTSGIGKALSQMARDNAITQENIETFIKETGADREAVKKVIERRTQPGIVSANQRKQYESIQLDDFIIKSHPKDTFVMAGGTKLGQDSQKTNQLLERLISAVERGGNVYIDGNKAGRALVLASHKLS